MIERAFFQCSLRGVIIIIIIISKHASRKFFAHLFMKYLLRRRRRKLLNLLWYTRDDFKKTGLQRGSKQLKKLERLNR